MIFERFDSIDSTNTEAKRQLEMCGDFSVLHKKVLVAQTQTSGRGRLNRNFYSPSKGGLYFSEIYATEETDFAKKGTGQTTCGIGGGKINDSTGDFQLNPAMYTVTAAVAVTRGIKSTFGIETGIKWVNDIYLNGKKICGILSEGVINSKTGRIGAVVIGIGVNLFFDDELPSEIKGKAGSIFEKSGLNQSPSESFILEKKEELLQNILIELNTLLDNAKSQTDFLSITKEYKSRSILIGKTVTVSPVINQNEKNYTAKVLDITEDAKLCIQTADGQNFLLDSGEVTLQI